MAIPSGFLLLLPFLLLTPSSAMIRFKQLRSNSGRIISFDEFGFTNSGHLDVNISSLSLSNPNADLSKLGFFLTTRHSWLRVVQHLQHSDIGCALDSSLVRFVSSFTSLNPDSSSSLSTSFSVPDADEYSLVFANCVPNLRVSIDVRSAMYNVEPKSGRRNYLPAGRTALPTVYSVSAVLYFTIVVSWFSFLHQKRLSVSDVHQVVFTALILRALILLCEAEDRSFINRTGLNFNNFGPLFYVKVFLGFLMAPFPHPIFAGVLRTVIDETGPKSLVAWEEVRVFVDEAIIIWIVMVTVVWWTKKLKEAAKSEEKAAAKLMKLALYRNYFVAVFCYMVFFTGLLMYTVEMFVSYEYEWTGAVVLELVHLAFYLFIGCKWDKLK